MADKQIFVKFEGDSRGLVNAGKLSRKELDEISKAATNASSKLTGMGARAGKFGTAVGAAAAASAASMALLTKQTVDYAAEVDRLAAVSNITTDDFQRRAAGARLLGVEQEKLADIFKDTNDKIGDFLQNGAGPLADFFNNIAPQVGVTAEQFRNLSGPDALELYVSSLEKANVSQNEMTFYMEAIASDATLLLPLLRNNGDGFKVLGNAAEEAGAIMSQKTLRSSQELNAVLYQMGLTGEGLKNTIREQTLPTITDLALEFSNLSEDATFADGVTDLLNGTMKITAATAVGAFAAMQLFAKGIAAIGAAGAAADQDGSFLKDFLVSPVYALSKFAKDWYDNSDDVGRAIDVSAEDLQDTILKYGEVLNGIWDAGEGDDTKRNERIKQIIEFQNKVREALGKNRSSASFLPGGQEEIDKAITSLATLQASLQLQNETFGQSATEVLEYRLTVGDLSDEVTKAGKSGKDYADGILAASSALEKQKSALDAATKATAQKAQDELRAKQIISSLRTEEERLADSIREVNLLVESGFMTEIEGAESISRMVDQFEKLNDKTKENEKRFKALKDAVNGWGADFADAMVDSTNSFDDFVQNVLVQLQKIAIQQATQPLFSAFGDAISESTGGFGGSLSKMFGGIPQSANGNVFTGPSMTTIAERGQPEAVLPLARVGGQLGVQVAGGTGKGDVNVEVYVDASGGSVQGDQEGADLGKAFSQAVRSVLIEERRPGGLLS